MEGTRTVHFHDPVRYAKSNLPMTRPNVWPVFFSSSNDVPSLKSELVRDKRTHSANFQLEILHNGIWLPEDSVCWGSRLPDPVYARAMPMPKALPVHVTSNLADKLGSFWKLLCKRSDAGPVNDKTNSPHKKID